MIFGKKHQTLAGKLLLSSALVAVSLMYGWWQRHGADLNFATVSKNVTPALPLTALASLPMYQPPPPQAPLSLVTGTPMPGATAPVRPGSHLRDGDYLSDMQQFEWGDLTVKISVRGGKIAGAQVVQYPDHRAELLELSRKASPILDSEVIKTQQSEVDVVTSATETSYVYRNAIASAIAKASRSR